MCTKGVTFSLLGALLWIGAGCTKLGKLQKSSDWREKYNGGVAYYEDKDYSRAAVLLEQVRPMARGLPEGEKVEFMLAYCQYHESNYLLAASQFRMFYEVYGRSSRAEEARFMEAYALYASSPAYTLDQQSSAKGMAAMQDFINRYPNSTFSDRAIEVVKECQQKLEKKAYKNAELYLTLRMYKAALVAFESFEQTFPDSRYLEQVAFMKVEAQFQWAEKSIPGVKQERLQDVINMYVEFIDHYPDSMYLKDAERYYVKSKSELEKQNQKL